MRDWTNWLFGELAILIILAGGYVLYPAFAQEPPRKHVIHETVYMTHCPNGGVWTIDTTDSDSVTLECFYDEPKDNSK